MSEVWSSGAATEGGGENSPLCNISYIYTNTTTLVLHIGGLGQPRSGPALILTLTLTLKHNNVFGLTK